MSDKVKQFAVPSVEDLPVLLDGSMMQQIAPQPTDEGIDSMATDYDNISGIKPDAGLYGFTEVIGTSKQLVPQWGYVANNAAQVSLNLPVRVDFGTRMVIVGRGLGGWKITQNAGQQIIFGIRSTTAGASGYLENTERYDTLEIICVSANTTFLVVSSIGNITIA